MASELDILIRYGLGDDERLRLNLPLPPLKEKPKDKAMIICVECKKEMKCETNGIQVKYSHGHTYMGDKYNCPECGRQIVNCNTNPTHSDESKPDDILMTPLKETKESCKLRMRP